MVLNRIQSNIAGNAQTVLIIPEFTRTTPNRLFQLFVDRDTKMYTVIFYYVDEHNVATPGDMFTTATENDAIDYFNSDI